MGGKFFIDPPLEHTPASLTLTDRKRVKQATEGTGTFILAIFPHPFQVQRCAIVSNCFPYKRVPNELELVSRSGVHSTLPAQGHAAEASNVVMD